MIGIISKELESKAAEWLDSKLIKGGIWDTIDGPAFKLVITQLDDNFGEKIPEPWKTEISEILSYIFNEGDLDEALRTAADLADLLIDVPYLDDETEKLLFSGLVQIVSAIFANMNIKK